MRHTNDMIHIGKSEFQQFVGQNRRRIGEAKQRMVGKTHDETERAGMQDGFMTHGRECLVAMHNLDTFPYEDVPEQRQSAVDRRQSDLLEDAPDGQIVHFETVRHASNASSLRVIVCHNHYFMSPLQQFVRELHEMRLDAAHVGEEEVGH